MGDDLIQETVVRVAAGHNLTGAATFDHSVEGRQVQVGLHLVRVMALETGIAQDGKDVVLVGDLVSRLGLESGQQGPGQRDGFQVPSHLRFQFPLVVRPQAGGSVNG